MVILPCRQKLMDQLASVVGLVGDGHLEEQDAMSHFQRFTTLHHEQCSTWITNSAWSELRGRYWSEWNRNISASRSWRSGT